MGRKFFNGQTNDHASNPLVGAGISPKYSQRIAAFYAENFVDPGFSGNFLAGWNRTFKLQLLKKSFLT